MNLLTTVMTTLYADAGDYLGDSSVEITNVVHAIQSVLVWIVGIGGPIAIIIFGIKLYFAKGKEEQQAAKSRFIWIIAATLVIFGATAIWTALSGFWNAANN